MGLLDIFNPQPTTPSVPSVLPPIAKQQIMAGQLPVLQPKNLFLKDKEVLHFADRAIYEKRTINKRRIRKNTGYSMPGLFKGTRIYRSGGDSSVQEEEKFETIKGLFYVTSKRVIFIGGHESFDEKITDLLGATPYANCIELQFEKNSYKVFVPDGNIIHQVLRLVH